MSFDVEIVSQGYPVADPDLNDMEGKVVGELWSE